MVVSHDQLMDLRLERFVRPMKVKGSGRTFRDVFGGRSVRWGVGEGLSAVGRKFVPGQAASASAACRSASRVSQSLRSLRVNFHPNGSLIWL